MIMRLPIAPPLDHEKAAEFVRKLESFWNEGKSQQLNSVFSEDCEWRDNERQLTGNTEIMNLMNECRNEKVNYRVRGELWSHSFFRIAVSFQSEWRDSKKDSKFRNCGHVFIRLDSSGKIKEFCLSSSGSLSECRD